MPHQVTSEFDSEAYAREFIARLSHDLDTMGHRALLYYYWTDDNVLFVLARHPVTGQEAFMEVWPTRSGLWDGLESNVAAAVKMIIRHTTKPAPPLDPSRARRPVIARPRIPF